MDPGKALGDLQTDAEIAGGKGGMFSAGALTVIFTADDRSRLFLLCPAGKAGIDLFKDKL